MKINLHATMAIMGQTIAGIAAALMEPTRKLKHKPLIILPGGTSPLPVFDAMRALRVDWAGAHITTTDERVVSFNNAASNAGQIADFKPLWLCDPAAEKLLQSWPWPADLAVLGFGLDGHIASLFSHQPWEAEAGAFLIPAHAPNPPHKRLSLTFSCLETAQNIIILAPDPAKMQKITEIRDGAHADTPVAQILHRAAERLQIHGVLA